MFGGTQLAASRIAPLRRHLCLARHPLLHPIGRRRQEADITRPGAESERKGASASDGRMTEAGFHDPMLLSIKLVADTERPELTEAKAFLAK